MSFASGLSTTCSPRSRVRRKSSDSRTIFVAIFARKDEAQRFLQDLPARFGAFGLSLHPDKTRLVPFLRPDRVDDDDDRPGSFNFLGFTHYWALSRRGRWYVMQKTAKDRFGRALRRVREWCRLHRHDSLESQQRALAKKLNGHYAYFGLTANFNAIARFLHEVKRVWQKALARRSQRGLTWERMTGGMKRYPLPAPRVFHRYGM